jgi:hypothetical protein
MFARPAQTFLIRRRKCKAPDLQGQVAETLQRRPEGFSSAEMFGTRGSAGGWMSETDSSKESLFNLASFDFRSQTKSIRGEFVARSLEIKFVPKNSLTPRGFLLDSLSQYIRKFARLGRWWRRY